MAPKAEKKPAEARPAEENITLAEQFFFQPDAANMRSTEETVKALLNYLVDPLLPAKCSNIILSEQDQLAKQVHGTVIVYNYYHRKQFPQLRFLDFDNFCKLSIVLNPSLLPYISQATQLDESLDEKMELMLSLTEKSIVDACFISSELDASKVNPSIEDWPITTVSVFLVDSKKKNCFLLHENYFKGVWSLVEADFPKARDQCVIKMDGRNKKSFLKNSSNIYLIENESPYRKAAFLAVQEAVGLPENGIEVLESHITYSIYRKKEATLFYIMHSTDPNSDFHFQDSVEDVISSLSGHLTVPTAFGYSHTAAVEYFPMLPFHSFLEDWFSRSNPSNSVRIQKKEEAKKQDFSKSPDAKRKVFIQTDPPIGNKIENLLSEVSPRRLEKRYKKAIVVENEMEENDSNSEPQSIAELAVNQDIVDSISPKDARITLQNPSNFDNLENVCNVIASKDNELSKAAIEFILSKRDKLTLRQRELGDEIAQCDKDIKTILLGEKKSLELKVQAVIESCSVSRVRNLYNSDTTKMDKLSSSNTHKRPCQALDALCVENGWRLSVYHVSATNGGFCAEAIMNEEQFQRSSNGDVCDDPVQARHSAAAKLLWELNPRN